MAWEIRCWSAWCLSSLVATTACGLDLADSNDPNGDTETSSGTGEPGTTAPGDWTGDGGTGPGGQGDSSSESGGDSGAEPEDDDAPELADCTELKCDNGFCEVTEDGPQCVCEEGFASTGLACIPCDSLDGGKLPALVPTVQPSFVFLIDGEAPPASAFETGWVWLSNRTTGDEVFLGSTFQQTATTRLVPGTYDVVYEFREGGDVVPRNTRSVVERIEVQPNIDSYTIDVPTSSMRGSIAFESGAPPAAGLDRGRLWLVDAHGGERTYLGDTFDGTYDARIIPGTYALHYTFVESTGHAPSNPDGFLTTLEVAPNDSPYNINIETTLVSGDITVDGDLVDSGLDAGDLELVDVDSGDRFWLASTHTGTFARTLLPGTYDVVFSVREPGPRMPQNRNTVVTRLEVTPDTTDYPINLETALVSGTFSLDGAEIPSDGPDSGTLTLRDPSGGWVELGSTTAGSFERRVLAGTYDIVYSQQAAGSSMPVNTSAHLESRVVSAGAQPLDIDIPTVEVNGNLALDGEDAPDVSYDDGRLYLRNRETGDSALLGNTREGGYRARVVPGTYDIVYENELSTQLLPVNRRAILETGVVVNANAALLNIDVPVSTLSGEVQIDGTSPQISEGLGHIYLRDTNSQEAVFMGHTGTASFTKPLTPGTYLVEYRGVPAEGETLGESLPANSNAPFACYAIE